MAEDGAGKKEGGEDASMEEILQSIRSIIAEDGDGAKPAEKSAEAKVKDKNSEDVQGSDVLELTQTAPADDVLELGAEMQIETVPAQPTLETPPPAPAAAAPASNDVLNMIDDALTSGQPAPAATPAPAAAAPVAPPPPPPPAQQPAPAATGDALLSSQTVDAASSAIKKLQAAVEPPLPNGSTTPSPNFQSGNTVEAMVHAMLKPMVKDWLDKNLPAIVERIVTVEIRRLSK